MSIELIKNLNITTEDFDLMIKALDKMKAPDLGHHLLEMMFEPKQGVSDFDEMRRKSAKRAEEVDREFKLIRENATLTQAKLISLKRLLIEEDAIKSVNDIFNPDKS